MISDNFIFEKEWADLIISLPKEMRLEAYDYIILSVFQDTPITLENRFLAAFLNPILAKIKKEQLHRKRLASAAKKRRNKSKNNTTITQDEQTTNATTTHITSATNSEPNIVVISCDTIDCELVTQPQHTDNTIDAINEEYNMEDREKETKKDKENFPLIPPYKEKENKKRKRDSFVPPTIEQVQEYLTEKGITTIDAETFVAFYESKGWMVGRNKMKSWKAAIITWKNNRINSIKYERTNSTSTSKEQRDREFAEHIAEKLFNSQQVPDGAELIVPF